MPPALAGGLGVLQGLRGPRRPASLFFCSDPCLMPRRNVHKGRPDPVTEPEQRGGRCGPAGPAPRPLARTPASLCHRCSRKSRHLMRGEAGRCHSNRCPIRPRRGGQGRRCGLEISSSEVRRHRGPQAWLSRSRCFFLFSKLFILYWRLQPINNAAAVSGGQRGDSALYTRVHSPPNSPPIQAPT